MRVLIIDEDTIGRLVLRADLRAAGIGESEISEAATAIQGVRIAVWNKPNLVFLGATPDIPGLEVIRQLRNTPSFKAAKFAVMSADTNEGTRRKALKIADFFLPKPFSGRQIKEIVEAASRL